MTARPVQITTAFPPAICGVGDYSARLAAKMTELGSPLHTLIANAERASEEQAGVSVVAERSANALRNQLDALAPSAVLLHFSGYGYGSRGLCRWLVDGLSAWKQGGEGRRLVTLFHEVYATGPIWRSSFWTAGLQRQIARDLARLSDVGFVTSSGGMAKLHPLNPPLPLELMPVFSNVGEPRDLPPFAARDPVAVVFGGSRKRASFYTAAQKHADLLAAGFDRLNIREVVDIGPGGVAPSFVDRRPVRTLGTLPASEASSVLSRSKIGLLDYPLHVFTKSGIAASYFAHGLLTVNTSTYGRLPRGLAEGREFIAVAGLVSAALDPDVVASAGHAWYRPHRLEELARMLMARLQ